MLDLPSTTGTETPRLALLMMKLLSESMCHIGETNQLE